MKEDPNILAYDEEYYHPLKKPARYLGLFLLSIIIPLGLWKVCDLVVYNFRNDSVVTQRIVSGNGSIITEESSRPKRSWFHNEQLEDARDAVSTRNDKEHAKDIQTLFYKIRDTNVVVNREHEYTIQKHRADIDKLQNEVLQLKRKITVLDTEIHTQRVEFRQ